MKLMAGDGLCYVKQSLRNPSAPSWNKVVNEHNITGSMLNGIDNGFDSFLGVKYWNLLGNKLRIEQGSSSTSLDHQAYYDFYLDQNTYYALRLSNEKVTLGGLGSGFYSSHNNKPLTTYDSDHDTNSSNVLHIMETPLGGIRLVGVVLFGVEVQAGHI